MCAMDASPSTLIKPLIFQPFFNTIYSKLTHYSLLKDLHLSPDHHSPYLLPTALFTLSQAPLLDSFPVSYLYVPEVPRAELLSNYFLSNYRMQYYVANII